MTRRLAIVAIGLAMVMVPLFAATTATADLTISGTMPLKTAISVAGTSPALDVSLGASNVVVANVTETSNSKAGYSVSLATLNGSALKQTDGTDTVAYTLTYAGVAVSFNSGTATLTTSSVKSNPSTPKALAISFGTSFKNEGTYQDTLTFTITSN